MRRQHHRASCWSCVTRITRAVSGDWQVIVDRATVHRRGVDATPLDRVERGALVRSLARARTVCSTRFALQQHELVGGPMRLSLAVSPAIALAAVSLFGLVIEQRPLAQGAAALPMPTFHHIHLNSTDPERSLDWYSKFWPRGKKTTYGGFPGLLRRHPSALQQGEQAGARRLRQEAATLGASERVLDLWLDVQRHRSRCSTGSRSSIPRRSNSCPCTPGRTMTRACCDRRWVRTAINC